MVSASRCASRHNVNAFAEVALVTGATSEEEALDEEDVLMVGEAAAADVELATGATGEEEALDEQDVLVAVAAVAHGGEGADVVVEVVMTPLARRSCVIASRLV